MRKALVMATLLCVSAVAAVASDTIVVIRGDGTAWMNKDGVSTELGTTKVIAEPGVKPPTPNPPGPKPPTPKPPTDGESQVYRDVLTRAKTLNDPVGATLLSAAFDTVADMIAEKDVKSGDVVGKMQSLAVAKTIGFIPGNAAWDDMYREVVVLSRTLGVLNGNLKTSAQFAQFSRDIASALKDSAKGAAIAEPALLDTLLELLRPILIKLLVELLKGLFDGIGQHTPGVLPVTHAGHVAYRARAFDRMDHLYGLVY